MIVRKEIFFSSSLVVDEGTEAETTCGGKASIHRSFALTALQCPHVCTWFSNTNRNTETQVFCGLGSTWVIGI